MRRGSQVCCSATKCCAVRIGRRTYRWLVDSVRDALEGEHRRLAAVRDYVLERRCRVSRGLEYLGDADASPCGLCDLCRGGPPVEARPQLPNWRAALDPAEVRSLSAQGPDGPDVVGVARALCQISSTRSRPYRKHPPGADWSGTLFGGPSRSAADGRRAERRPPTQPRGEPVPR